MSDRELLQAMYDDLQKIKQNTQELKQDTQELKQDTQELKQDTQELKQDTQELKQRLTTLEDKVTKVEFILDNEIRVNIQRVAEGHLDLSRNLHEAMKPSNELEMLAIKVRVLESDVRELKSKIS